MKYPRTDEHLGGGLAPTWMTSAMPSKLLPKMKILLFLREADEQLKHLELLSTILFGARSVGNLWDVSQHLAKEAMNLRRKLTSLTNY